MESLGSGDPLQFVSYSEVGTSINYFTGVIQLWIQLTRL